MAVLCYACDCRYNKNSECTKDSLYIDMTGSCEDYSEYYNTSEYSEPYYVAMKCVDGQYGKVKKQGKKIKYRGYTFYTDAAPYIVDNGDFSCTEEKTGALLIFQNLNNPKVWESFIREVKKHPSVMSYPDAIKIKDGEYVISEDKGV